MRRTTTILIVAMLAAGSILPVAAAGWKYRGTNEPDTSLDVTEMWAEADTTGSTARKVYMSGFQHSSMLWVNPNSGALGSRMQQQGSMEHSVLLGVWKDCNKDGYIGFGEAGLMEYRSTLLLDDSICPATPVNVASPPTPYPFNDGGWVREFNWIGDRQSYIGPPNNQQALNPTITVVAGTQVWFDWGLPNAEPGTTCPISGGWTIRNVGGFLQWSDCFTNYQVVRNLNSLEDSTGLPVGGWDREDLRNSDATLNIENPAWTVIYGPDGDGFGEGPMGRDHHGRGETAPRAVTVWDCSDPKSPQPSPSTEVNPSGSVYEPLNETYNVATLGTCKTNNPGDPLGNNHLVYVWPDATTEGTNAFQGKDEPSDVFIFSVGNRRLAPQVSQGPLGPFGPVDGGLALERDLDTIGPSWRANTGWTQQPMLVNRDGLEPTPGQYISYYVKLGGTDGLLLPTDEVKTYGPNCSSGAEIVNGWRCDPAAWEARCTIQGADIRVCITIGEAYHLRDVDCFDNRLVAGVPVYASLVQLSQGGPCSDGPQTTIDP